MAAALLESTALPLQDYGIEPIIAQMATMQMPAEGEGGQAKVFYYSPSVAGYVTNSNHSKLLVDDSDIVKLTVTHHNQWKHELYFDGSDVGLTKDDENVDAFAIRHDGSLLFSTVGKATVTGATAQHEDLLLFRPTQLGAHTSGTWELFFDGSDVGLSSAEGLDGVSELPDGRLIISTNCTSQVPGVSGSNQPEDLLSFNPITTGSNTTGAWTRYFDGSDAYLGSGHENIDGVSVDDNGTTIHLSTTSLFWVPGLLGFSRDIFTFEASQLGASTVGTFRTPLTLNGSHRGMLFNSVDAIHVPSETLANQPPVIAAIGSPSIHELAPYSLQLSASDPDTPVSQLVWSLVSGPTGSSLSASGQFTWMPSESQGPGNFPVIVAVSDGSLTAQTTFTISVTEVNQPPLIAPIASPTIEENTTYNVLLSASDPDLPASILTWSLVSGPGGAVVNATTGRFAWRPTELQGPGVFPIVVAVTDSNLSTQATFTVTVTEVNQAPVIAPIASPTIEVNTTYNILLTASDPDLPANTLTWSLVSGPSGAVVNATTGRFAWRPTNAQGVGLYPIVVAVSDGNLSTQSTFTITVSADNQPPIIAPIASPTIDENATYHVLLSASDPDLPAQSLTWSLVSGPSGAVVNPTTGRFAWRPTESQGPGVFPIVVAVSDGDLSTQATFTITVAEVNQAPIIASIASPTIEEGATHNVLLSASDPDLPAQSLTWSLVSGPSGAVVNATTGRFAWRPTESQGPGVFPIELAVSDGVLSTQATFTVTVTEVNQPPVLVPIGNQTMSNNQTLSLLAVATDPNLPANVLTYSLVTAPTSATINPQTGLITWLADQTGTVPFTVQVTDQGGLSATQSFQVEVIGLVLRELDSFATEFVQTLTVPNAASALRIDFETPAFDGSSQRDIRDAFEIELLDLNGNPLVLPYTGGTEASFNWTEGLTPVGAAGVTATISATGATSSVTINLAGLTAGTQFQMRLRLVNNDSDNGTVVRINSFDFITATSARPAGVSFSSTVNSVGPVDFASIQDVTGSFAVNYGRTTLAGANDRLLVDVRLQNESSQTYRDPVLLVIKNLSSLDANALRPDSLTPEGHPYFRVAGLNGTISTGQSALTRQIGFLNTRNDRFDYEVQILAATNTAPGNFVSTPLTGIEAGDVYRYTAVANDADGDTLTYSIVSGPSEAAISPATGLFTWNTTSTDVGSHRVTIRATDTFGAFSEQTFDLQVFVTLQNRPPIFVTDPVTDAIASSGFEITTVAMGDQPVGVSVIGGFQGPRLVSINAGDQSVGVHAGQNKDRFDVTTIISTGEPKPTNAIFQSGYSVDVGLPPFLRSGDSNDVLGMDQGDFNGDGILDLVAITSTDPFGAADDAFYAFAIIHGDGDGNFRQPQIIPIANTASASYKHLNAADLNGDGNLDVIVINETNGSAVTISGNGDGTFGALRVQTLSVSMNDYRLADINNDGILDLYGRNFNRSAFGWLPGVGDGTYSDFIGISGGGGGPANSGNYQTKPYQAVDLEGDGDLDFVFGSLDDSRIELWTNNGSQNFVLAGTLVGLRRASSQLQGVTDLRVADFTGDGHLDIFYGGTSRNGYSIYVGNPTPLSFTYQDASNQVGNFVGESNPAGDDRPIDLDGDGDLDLVMGNGHVGEKYTVRVLINGGLGFFTVTDYAPVDFIGQHTEIRQESNDTNSVAGVLVGDYNRDGVVDLSYFTRGDNDFNGVGIIPGTRPGEFYGSRTIDFPTDFEVLAADFNGDGIIDLLSMESAIMFLGSGDGTFQPGFPAVSVPNRDLDAQIADFNQDGILDIIASRSQGFYVALGNGDGTFNVSFNTAIPGSFNGYSHISNGDFNNDGLPDIIARAGVEQFIDVWLNQASNPGTFVISLHLPILGGGTLSRGFQHAVAEGDFNEDGFLDFAAGSLLESDTSLNSLKIYRGAGDGTFTLTHEQATYNDAFLGDFYHPGELQSGDVNEDGHLDVVSFTTGGPVVHLGIGDGTFQFLDQYFADSDDSSAKGSYLVDIDEDGHLDMVQLVFTDSVNVRRGRGDGTFNDPIRLNSIGRTNSASFADLDHDGHMDLVYARRNTNGGQPYGAANLYFGVRDTLVDVLAVDLNGDGNEEVLAINEANDRLKLFVGDNLGGLNRHPDLLTGRAPQAVATADLDGDGTLELITANRAGRSLSVFSGSVATGYVPIDFPLENGAIDVAAADLDGDGNPDLVALDDTVNALWIYTGNGSTILATPVALALGDVASKLTLADATGDGPIDAVITLPETNRLMILPNLGLGFQSEIFGAPIYITLSSSPSDVQAIDLNADGHIDLISTLPNENIVSVLFGRGSNQFARAQQIGVGAEPKRVVLADVDEDGRTDLIVTNSGDNSASVIYNRFDPNEVYRYNSDAIDPDSDTITYAIEDGPGGLIFNSATGQLLWAASPDQVGEHNVTLSADDGRGGVATQSFKIQVEPARDNASPLIATVPNTKIGAADTFTYQATAIDNDRDTIRYRLVDAPAGATINPTTGLLEWDGRTDLAISTVSQSDGRIEIAANAGLQTATFTSEAWFFFDTLPASNGLAGLFLQFGSYTLSNRGNSLLRLDVQYPNAGSGRVEIPFVFNADRWYHFALVVDDAAQTMAIYADGREVHRSALVESLAFDPQQNKWVGSNGTFGLAATIDNYRHWTVARTADEIREGLGRQYDGDTRLVVDYRFDDINTFSVRDYSPAGNTGFRIINSAYPELVPGLANPGLHSFTIGVEDGRGGFDTQSFILDVLPELRGSIRGQAFSDLDQNGTRNGSESVMPGVHLFIDSNGNGYPDPSESQTITDASGNYQFNGLLPGQYAPRVSAVAGFEIPAPVNVSVTANTNTAVDLALEQLALGQIRGQLRTAALDPIAHWKVFADLDVDGQWDDNEPSSTSDGAGSFAIAGLDAGTYTIRAELPAGWANTTGFTGQNVTLAANAVSTGNNFVLQPTNTSVTGGLQFVTRAASSLEARQTFRYASIAIGIHNESIAYDLSLAPDGMAIDPATGLVAWRPTISQVGEHLVVLRATSASGSISLQEFTLTVTAPNTAPVLANDLLGTAYVGLVYAVNLAAQNAQSQAVSFNLLSGPSTATLNAITGELRWTPTLADVGTVSFWIEMRDASGSTSVVNASVQVVNAQPAVTPYQINLPRTLIGLGQDYLSQVTGHDALGRPLSWSLQSGPAEMAFSPNGTLRWTPGNSDLGMQTIIVRATDVDGGSATRSFDLQVVGRPVNAAPIITSIPLTSTVLGSEYQYTIAAEDADADPLAYALLDAPIGMSIHPSLGSIRWTPAMDQKGESDVSVQVTDPDGASVIQTFKLKVSRSGGPPAITSIPPTEAAVGVSYLYSVAARDAESDPLIYRLLAAPAGMTIAETTGEISWTPLAGQLGQQDVVIEVSDGIGGAVTQAFAIRVANGVPNLPPVINTTAPRFGSIGTAYSYTLQATDPESTALTYTLGQGPTGLTINENTGLVAWTPTVGQTGKFVVTLIATDTGGASAIESFELDVLAANSLPTIASTAPQEIAAGALFIYQVLGRDADLDQLSYELTTSPAGAAIDSFGKITWPTTVALIGSHDFVVRVSDPRGGVATQSFTLSVIEDIVPPKVSLIESLGDANRNILPWQGPFVVYARAIDNVAVASLTLNANGQDIPLSASGTATFTFENWSFQTINATATAIDTNGNITTKTITFDYDFPEGWSDTGTEDIPTVAITSPIDTATVFGLVSINGTASHADFAGYKLSYRRIDETTYTQFFESTTAVVNGQLGVWDTSLLIDDEYVIRLEAASNSGVVNVVEHNVGLSGELKLGNFQLSFTDMVIPVAGIPIEITRIYDSLHADREGDFGFGWRLEYRNTDLRVGLPKSGLEDIGIYTPFKSGVKVYLNVPGLGRQGFTFNPDVRVLPGFGGNDLVLARPRFTPDPGVTSSLSTGTSGYLQVNEFGELFAPGNIPYNPASPDFGGAFVLTTKEGVVYRIDGANGDLQTLRDRNGVQIQFTESGIVYGDGSTAISIQRDVSGRITSIIDPNGNETSYAYSFGDLVASRDREGNQTDYAYTDSGSHLLETITDPLGRQPTRYEFDDLGRLIAIVNAVGDRFEIANDLDASLQTFTDAFGRINTVGYNDFGNVVLEIDALGNRTDYEYDNNRNQTLIVDPLGNRTRFRYTSGNNLAAIIDATGNVTSIAYDQLGNATDIVDSLGNVVKAEFDSKGNLVRSVAASGASITYAGANVARPELIRFSDGSTVTAEFNALGNQTLHVAPNGLTTELEYDNNANVINSAATVIRDGAAVRLSTSWVYDKEGRVLEETGPDGNTTRYEYDANGRLIATEFDDGSRQETDYAATGQVSEQMFADNTSISMQYDAVGNVASRTDRAGRVTRYEYDAVNRLIAEIYPDETPDDLSDNPRISMERDAVGNIVATTDELGNRTEFEYDLLGRRIAIRNALGFVTKFQYDAIGRMVRVTDARNATTKFEYDAAGNMTRQIFADGTQIVATYDSLGNQRTSLDQNGLLTQFKYNELNQVTLVLDPIGGRTEYLYDLQGNLIAQIDANRNTTRFAYDSRNRPTSVTLPEGQTSATTYDSLGLATSYTDFIGNVTNFQYDDLGQLIRQDFSDGSSIQYGYTPNGLLATATNSEGTETYTYDERERLIEYQSAIGATIQYSYDDAGNRLTQTTVSGTIQYSYDALGQLTAIDPEQFDPVIYVYDAVGNLSETKLPNGVTIANQYDLLGRVILVEHFDASDNVLTAFDYDLDSTGRRLSVTEQDGRTIKWTYDDLYRLVGETITDPGMGTVTTNYQYDAVGNRLTIYQNGTLLETYSYNANDQLVSVTNAAGQETLYNYDANGNLVEKSNGDRIERYTWDTNGRLASVEVIEGGTTTVVQNTYDASGRRISKTVDGVTEKYVLDVNRQYPVIIDVLDASDAILRSMVNGLQRISQSDATEMYFFGYDAHSGTRVLYDSAGNVVERYAYDAFGQERLVDDPLTDFLYQGEQRDLETGLDYLRARFLDVGVGRFLGQDPFDGIQSDPLTLNDFNYVSSDPINYADPSGQFKLLAEALVSFTVRNSISIGITLGFIGIRTISAYRAGELSGSKFVSIVAQEAALAVGFGIVGRAIPVARGLISPTTRQYFVTLAANSRPFAEVLRRGTSGFVSQALSAGTFRATLEQGLQSSSVALFRGLPTVVEQGILIAGKGATGKTFLTVFVPAGTKGIPRTVTAGIKERAAEQFGGEVLVKYVAATAVGNITNPLMLTGFIARLMYESDEQGNGPVLEWPF